MKKILLLLLLLLGSGCEKSKEDKIIGFCSSTEDITGCICAFDALDVFGKENSLDRAVDCIGGEKEKRCIAKIVFKDMENMYFANQYIEDCSRKMKGE